MPKSRAGLRWSRLRARKLSDVSAATLESSVVIAETTRWLERAVIGLNLCPFAKAVHVKGQIRYAVCLTASPEHLLTELIRELQILVASDPNVTDTTLLIHPNVFSEFLDYNDFLEVANSTITELKLDGVIQTASFHPQYQFADTEPDDITNFTNRSPYPTLHLLREESVTRAVAAFPEASVIFEKNIETMTALGRAGWEKLE